MPRGARRRVPARELGRGLLPDGGRTDRAAPVRRRRRAADGVRRRHHGPRAPERALRAAREAGHQGLRGGLRLEARRRRRRVQGRHLLGPPARGVEGDLREGRHPRHRRRGTVVHRDDERLLVHGRRDDARAARGRAAEGHGDDAVPPDDARAERRPDHRGVPRRGRLPAERGRRALPLALRAERDGARVARRHLARRADRDRRRARRQRQRVPRPAPPRSREDPRAPARDA